MPISAESVDKSAMLWTSAEDVDKTGESQRRTSRRVEHRDV